MSRGFVSAGHPAHAVILARPRDAKADRWLIAGIPGWRTYPCECHLGKPCDTSNLDVFKRCGCSGRIDVDRFDHLPPHCCAARAARLAAKATSVQIGASA